MTEVRADKRRKALVFLDYDMLVRHFVLARAFRELEKNWQVRYVFHSDSSSPKKGLTVDPASLGLTDWTYLEVPRARMGLWDKLYCVTALHNQRGTLNYRPRLELMASVRGWPRTRWYELLSLPGLFQAFRGKFLRDMGVFQPLDDFIALETPDLVIHPSILAGYFVNELLEICSRRAIPLTLLMNSWDNPSTKAMNTGIPARLVVWGPQTRQHAIEYMKMPPERVLEFGAAQFDVYRNPPDRSDAQLRADFGVPAELPILLYAGVSKSVDETSHLLALEQAIQAGRIARCHILYRPHPWRGGLVAGETNFFDVSWKYVSMDPHMEAYYRRSAMVQQQGFDMADYTVTANLLRLVSGVISPLSTMLLEAIMHGKPVLMFFPDAERQGLANDTIALGMKLPHFAEFWGPKGVEICTSPGELATAVDRLLVHHADDATRSELIRHASRYVVMDGPSYAERLAVLADELISSTTRAV